MKKTFYLLATVALVLLYSCNFNRKTENDNNKETIKIAAVLALTGPASDFGKEELKAIEIIQEDLKTKSLKNNYDIIIQDSKSTPKDGVLALNSVLIQKPKAIMTVLSSISLAIKPLTEKEQIPLFCVGANPEITKDANLVFRSLPTSYYQISKLSELITGKYNLNSFSVIYKNDDFGNGNKNAFIKSIEKKGGNILDVIGINPGQTDYRTSISKVIGNNPDCIFVSEYGNTLSRVLIQLKELNFKGIILTSIEVADPKVIADSKGSAEGVIFAGTYCNVKEGERHPFTSKYMVKFGVEPTLDAIFANDELNTIINTFEKGGDYPANFSALKGNGLEYESPNGSFKINSDGDFEYKLYLQTIKDGKQILLSYSNN
jgi:branched-chain amino acid transport system substrate-binding protein